MSGIELLKILPEEIQNQIITKYGSLEKYYAFVFNLYELDRQHFSNKSDNSKLKRQEIQNKLYDLEDELETFGLDDGFAVISEISADHGDKIVQGFLRKMGM